MKPRAMELGRQEISDETLIPRFVYTPLACYETRFREALREPQATPSGYSTSQQAGTPVTCRVAESRLAGGYLACGDGQPWRT
jgi:hypothetical protein